MTPNLLIYRRNEGNSGPAFPPIAALRSHLSLLNIHMIPTERGKLFTKMGLMMNAALHPHL